MASILLTRVFSKRVHDVHRDMNLASACWQYIDMLAWLADQRYRLINLAKAQFSAGNLTEMLHRVVLESLFGDDCT